jgi:hypothetical protein
MPVPADTRCNAKRLRQEGLCQRPAGWGTTHAGIGRCKLHGGSGSAASVTHGMRSRYLHAQLGPLIAQYAADQDPLWSKNSIGSCTCIERIIAEPDTWVIYLPSITMGGRRDGTRLAFP